MRFSALVPVLAVSFASFGCAAGAVTFPPEVDSGVDSAGFDTKGDSTSDTGGDTPFDTYDTGANDDTGKGDTKGDVKDAGGCTAAGCGGALKCCAKTGKCYDPKCLACCM